MKATFIHSTKVCDPIADLITDNLCLKDGWRIEYLHKPVRRLRDLFRLRYETKLVKE